MNRQPRTLLTLLLAAVVVGTALFLWRDVTTPPPAPASRSEPTVAPARGGSITATLRSEPRSFNRLVQASQPTDVYAHLTQARLIRVNRVTHEIEPWLAERWETSPDGRTFTLTLRDGVQWSDGTPFSSADVAFTFRAAYDPSSRSVLASTLRVGGEPIAVETPDARTVRLTYAAPFGPGIGVLDILPILPRHKLEPALEAGTFAQAWTSTTAPEELVGLGPFRLQRYEPGQRLVFERNPHYWRKAGDGTALPYLDQIVLEIVPDQNAQMLRVQSGAVDMPQDALRPDDIAAVRPAVSEGRLEMLEIGVSTDPNAFFLNLREKHWAGDSRRGWITRRELRQAISHAVDREAFAETVFLGAGVPVWGPITPGNPEWFSPNLPRYSFSVETARSLLAGIGLQNRDDDEWLEDAGGGEARFSVITFKGNQILERESALLRDNLRQVGIAIDVVPLEANALVDRMLKGEFEAIYLSALTSHLDPALSQDFWLSSGSAHFWNIGQATPATPWEAEIDELMHEQAAATDPAERRRLFNDVQRIFAENLPAIYFVAPRLYMAVSTRLINPSPSVLRPHLLWAADTIAVRP